MKPKIIAFSGAQSSGKTTMQNELYDRLHENQPSISAYYGVDSISRDAKNFGFSINELTNFETQYYIASRYIVADLETRKNAIIQNVKWIILDRSVIDVIPYTRTAENITQDEKGFIHDLLLNHYQKYPVDYLFYCKPLDSIKSDGYRSENKEFQNIVDHYFNEVLTVDLPGKYYTLEKKPILERLDDILEIITKKS